MFSVIVFLLASEYFHEYSQKKKKKEKRRKEIKILSTEFYGILLHTEITANQHRDEDNYNQNYNNDYDSFVVCKTSVK